MFFICSLNGVSRTGCQLQELVYASPSLYVRHPQGTCPLHECSATAEIVSGALFLSPLPGSIATKTSHIPESRRIHLRLT